MYPQLELPFFDTIGEEADLVAYNRRAQYESCKFEPEWDRMLAYAPEGARRCRQCTGIFKLPEGWPDPEFCSESCERDWVASYDAWLDDQEREVLRREAAREAQVA